MHRQRTEERSEQLREFRRTGHPTKDLTTTISIPRETTRGCRFQRQSGTLRRSKEKDDPGEPALERDAAHLGRSHGKRSPEQGDPRLSHTHISINRFPLDGSLARKAKETSPTRTHQRSSTAHKRSSSRLSDSLQCEPRASAQSPLRLGGSPSTHSDRHHADDPPVVQPCRTSSQAASRRFSPVTGSGAPTPSQSCFVQSSTCLSAATR